MSTALQCSRRAFLQGTAAMAGALLGTLNCSPPTTALAAEPSLGQVALSKGILYGCAATRQALSGDPEFARLVGEECRLLVPETELKWKSVEPQLNHFNFESGDWLLHFAQSHDMKFRGHALVWHEALPAWFSSSVDRSNARQVMTNHIQKVVEHYRGKMQSWDVVNEGLAFRGQGGELRDTPFLRLIGPEYVELAFHAAAQADNTALLVYNDNHLDYDTPDDEFRRQTLLKLLQQWLAKKVPIGALGIQAHLRAGYPFRAERLQTFLAAVSNLGLKIIISELDVSEHEPVSAIADRDAAVARALSEYLDVALSNTAVIAVVTWGISSRYTWLRGSLHGTAPRPLPYDDNLQPTSARQALVEALMHAKRR